MRKPVLRPIGIGDQFHWWTVISDPVSRRRKRYVFVRCKCGNEREITAGALFMDASRSCGCAPLTMYRDKLEGMFERIPESGCWLWSGHIDVHGYGVSKVESSWPRQKKAHRVIYEAFKGPLNGMHACHHCDVTCCVNPAHVYPGTHADNMADMIRRKRHLAGATKKVSGERHYKTKFTKDDVLSIRADKRLLRVIAQDYGVGWTTIAAIKNRQNWKHV